MPDDRVDQLRKGYAEDSYLGEPPDLSPLRAVAEREELAAAVSGLTDAFGHPLPADDPLAPLARDVAQALVGADSPCTTARRVIRCTGSAGCACCRLRAVMIPTAGAASWCPGRCTTCCHWTGIAGLSTRARRES